ncbi:MAG: hypothetical protein II968_03410 [Selenomonadaceae bacterium]|nr:hypothetical protein [Selenomonadaceae bacterium]
MRNFLAAIVLMILFATTAHAEIKTYTGYGEYLMTDETIDYAKEQAELYAQRDVLEKVCVFVKGQSLMIDNELTDDEVTTISAGVLHVTDTKFSLDMDEGGILIKSFVTAQIDTAELEKLLEQAIKERR